MTPHGAGPSSHRAPSNAGMGYFGRLPRELRDMIYDLYLTVDGGYACNSGALFMGAFKEDHKPSESRQSLQCGLDPRCKLKQAVGSPIDLALVFTCKSIAEEMRRGDLALHLNTITFSTFYSNEWRRRAGQLNNLRADVLDRERNRMLQYLGDCFDGHVCDEMKATFPVFAPIVDGIRDGTVGTYQRHSPDHLHYYGEAPSMYRNFATHALRCASVHRPEAFTTAMERYWLDQHRSLEEVKRMDLHCHAHCSIEPWSVPTRRVLMELLSYRGEWALSDAKRPFRHILGGKDRVKYRFSAAVSAIHFLESTPRQKRQHFRKFVLIEDQESVANPECHAQGLIPFCVENPSLRIERRCSLWRNIFRQEWTKGHNQWMYNDETSTQELKSDLITWHVSQWVMEALALRDYGMPAGSFSLLIDGDPAPQLCEGIFQNIVQRDIAWQLARSEARRRGFLPPRSWVEWHQNQRRIVRIPDGLGRFDYGYQFEGLPQAMQDIANGRSVVRCNFDAGVPWDVEKIVEERRHHNEDSWNEDWFAHDPPSWETVDPLPSWENMLRESIVYRSSKHR